MGKIIQFPGIEREVSPEYTEAVDYFLFLKAPDPAVRSSHNVKILRNIFLLVYICKMLKVAREEKCKIFSEKATAQIHELSPGECVHGVKTYDVVINVLFEFEVFRKALRYSAEFTEG
ncbi:MAG: hypothetical protein ACI4EN_04365 [Butyrivibrio sp.]